MRDPSSAPFRSAGGLLAVAAVAIAGCTNSPPESTGSWVEILQIEQSPDAVDVESLDTFQSVTVMPDRLVFRFEGGVHPLHRFSVVAGNSMGGYLRRVDTVTTLPDGSVEATTIPADIDEYYNRLNFIFHYRPRRAEDVRLADIEGAAVMAASSCEDTTPCEISGGRQFGSETAGCSLDYGGNFFFGPFVETDLTVDFPFDAGVDVDISAFPPGVSVDFEPTAYFDVEGQVRAGVRLSGTAAASMSCNADFAALLGGGEAPEITLAVVPIGPIPVTLSATPILNGTITGAADVGEFSAEAGATASAQFAFGVREGDEYQDGPNFMFDPFAEVTTARAGALSASANIEAGLQLKLAVGWSFDIPVVGDIGLDVAGTVDITGNLGVDFNADAGGCAWNVDVPWDAGVAFGVEAQLASWSWDHQWPRIVIASGSLGTLSGELPWCGGSPMCMGAPACTDALLDNGVCAGAMGFRSCGGGMYQRCTCQAGGSWTSCGSCLTP
jgi:hypothetical protein